jgi:VCBS repeat protein/FG-GAP repeat protein
MKWTSRYARRRLVAALLFVGAAVAAGVPSVLAGPAKPPVPPKKAAPKKAEPPKKVEPKESRPAPSSAAQAAAQDEVSLEAPAAPTAKANNGLQPPDGKWLKDKDGNEYFLQKLEKNGPFLRLGGNRVRTRWGIEIEVVKEDDKYFYYKIYRIANPEQPQRLVPEVTPEEKEKIRASYQVSTPESHRLAYVPFGTGLPTSGQWRNGFDLADMNGDGRLDIVHGPARKSLSYPTIFLGDGKGNWRRWSEARFPRLPFDYGDAAAADFNGDGKMDVALGMHLTGLAVLVGDGQGKFTDWGKGLDLKAATPGDDSTGFSSRAIAAVDWNQDGRPDVLALGEGPRLNLTIHGEARPLSAVQAYGAAVYLNQGDGTWVRKDQGTSNREIFGDSVTVGDFNGDRRKDFATGSNVMASQNLVNYGRQDGGWDSQDIGLVRPGSYVRSVAAGDFNRDGRDDLAVGYLAYEAEAWRGGLDLLLAQAGGGWTRRNLAVREDREEVSAVAAGDLDGDGNPDLVALTGKGETWIFLGDGKGGFTRETAHGIPNYPGECRGYHVQLADLDGDGRDEIVAGFAGESSAMFAPDLCPSGGGLQAWHLKTGVK